MPFFVIRGTFRLIDRLKTGTLRGFQPDGDSMQFEPNNPKLLDGLTKLQQPYRLTAINSVQLRFEGMDALELHFNPTKGGPSTHQPRPLADDSRDYLTARLGLDPVNYDSGRGLTVQPPAMHDGQSGYILSRSLDVHGRPVSFVFTGSPPARDGSEVRLTPTLLKKSFNYASILGGYSYPLFYDTLFRDLRDALGQAAQSARKSRKGIWARDKSQSGLPVTSEVSLQDTGVIFPKLFRRLVDYLAEGNTGMAKFKSWLAAKKEQVQDLDPTSGTFTNFTHLDNVVKVAGNRISLVQQPETLLFVSEK